MADEEDNKGWEDIDITGAKNLPEEPLEEIEEELPEVEEEEEEEVVKEEKPPVGEKQEEKQEKREDTSKKRKFGADLSPAAKRIQQLIAEKKQLQQELLETKKQKFETEKSSITAEKEKLEAVIKNKRDELKRAKEAGDSDKELDIQEELIKARVRLEAVDAYSRKQPEKFETPKEKPETSEHTLEWVQKNEAWFNKDVKKTRAAVAVNNALIAEGYDPNSSEFYEEVETRLPKWYPSLFDNDSQDDVEYKKTSEEKTKHSSKARQIVSGGSRSPNKKFVRLSIEEQDMARKMGLTNKQYAEEKAKIEKPDDAGYTTIFQ